MSTLIQFPDPGQQPLTRRVSEEVRALMGRYGVSQATVAKWLGLTQPAVSSRLRGATEWKVAEIERIAYGFSRHPAELMGGYATTGPRPDGGEGLPIMLRARRDSNPQPSDPKVRPFLMVG